VKVLGCTLPNDIVTFYRQCNGQLSGVALVEGYVLLSLARAVEEWKLNNSLFLEPGSSWSLQEEKINSNPAVKPVWWTSFWIPIAIDGSGNFVCVDLNPTEYGTTGQLIGFSHDTEERPLVANSLTKWLERIIEVLRGGKYPYRGVTEGLAPDNFADYQLTAGSLD
jgi:cell wall assembly regulator SMI1